MKGVIGFRNRFAASVTLWLLFAVGGYGQTDDRDGYPILPKAISQFRMLDVDGTQTSLDDLKGRVLVVTLWASWCGPCRSQIPLLVELQKRYQLEQLQVIGLNIGGTDGSPESDRDIKLFANRSQINFYLVHSPSELTKSFNEISKFHAVPQIFLIGRHGGIRGAFLGGGTDVNEKMVQLANRMATEKQ